MATTTVSTISLEEIRMLVQQHPDGLFEVKFIDLQGRQQTKIIEPPLVLWGPDDFKQVRDSKNNVSVVALPDQWIDLTHVISFGLYNNEWRYALPTD